MLLDLIDPRTGKRRGTCGHSRFGDVEAAVSWARDHSVDWTALTPEHRAWRLLQLADQITGAEVDHYVRAEVAGTGKPQHEARAEVRLAGDVLRFFAGAGRTQQAPAGGRYVPDHVSWVQHCPLGVVGAIVPWNYPLLMAMWRVAPALAAGNTVVLKPAETTPDTAQLLARHAQKVLGDGVLTTVAGDRETGRYLVGSRVDMIAFTGSFAAGCEVALRSGMRPCSLELGGNCPVIVLPDAPERTWDALAAAVTYNAGQSCAAPARVITLHSNYDQVVVMLETALLKLRAGRNFGPLNNQDQAERYDSIVNAPGASSVHHGGVAAGDGQGGGYWRPTCLLADVEDSHPAVVEEVFGPALTVQHVSLLEDAVELANSRPQGLAASVWSQDLGTALWTAQQVRAGEVWLNCHLVQSPELPHSGHGSSGTGIDLSTLALSAYQRPKTITACVDGPPTDSM